MKNTDNFIERRRGRERGSTLVEFTLVLIPMLALLMLALDTAWVIFAWASVQEGTREGVRFAITGQSDANIRAVVQRYSFGFIKDASSAGPIQVLYYSQTNPSQEVTGVGSNCAGSIVKVIVTGLSITPLAPIWRDKSPLYIGASATDIVEPIPVCPAR